MSEGNTMANRYETADVWAIKARKAGYPARSVYKLEEILKKFPLLPPAAKHAPGSAPALLDLGAAPGSWSLYLLRNLSGGFRLVACDILPLSRDYDGGLFDGENFTFLQGDMNAVEISEKIVRLSLYSLILCDAAPSTSGSRSLDSLRSVELAENALHYADRALTVGGSFVVKVFQGPDSSTFLKKMRGLFKTVKTFKPAACRPNSVETYFIGLEKR